MSEQNFRVICETCGGMHPTSEHPQDVEKETKHEWPKTDYVEDVPEAVVKGKELFEKARILIENEKPEEALRVFLEDEFAVAAYIAELIPRTVSLSIKPTESLKTLLGDEWDSVVALDAVQTEKPKKEIWMPIDIQATLEKYIDDKKVVPKKPNIQQLQGKGRIRNVKPGGGRWEAGRSKPFSPWVQKMYEKDRPHPGKEMATRTGFEILRDIIDGLKYDIQHAAVESV